MKDELSLRNTVFYTEVNSLITTSDQFKRKTGFTTKRDLKNINNCHLPLELMIFTTINTPIGDLIQ